MRQWVNLPKFERFVEHDVDSEERLGGLRFECEFAEAQPARFQVRVRIEDDAASYSGREKRGNLHFKLINAGGQFAEGDGSPHMINRVWLPAAGGNVYRIEAKYRNEVTEGEHTVEAVRKLYFQVIKMETMTVDVDVLKNFLIAEFWNEDRKHFLELKETPSGGDMPHHPNFTRATQSRIGGLVRAQYSNIKDPYCFVLVLVDQLATPADIEPTTKTGVTIDHASPTETVSTANAIYTNLEPLTEPVATWYYGGSFVPDDGGPRTHVYGRTVTITGRRQVTVDTSSLPDGATGLLRLNIKTVLLFRTGVSLGDNNAICVATRSFWRQRADDKMKATLVHEAGHKVGMVPGGATGGLDRQGSYYRRNGGHCNHAGNTCVMYGIISNDRDIHFCPVCSRSVRKLDLDTWGRAAFRRV